MMGAKSRQAAFTSLPIIDVGALLATDPKPETLRQAARQLHEACRDVGFFYVHNHGIPDELVVRVRQLAREWFALPAATKNELAVSPERCYRGYQGLGVNVTRYPGGFQRDWHEAIDLFREEDPAAIKAAGLPPSPLHGPNPWPHHSPELCLALQQYIELCKHLGSAIMQGIALGLDLSRDAFQGDAAGQDNSYWLIRCIHYPPLNQGPGHQVAVAPGPHLPLGQHLPQAAGAASSKGLAGARAGQRGQPRQQGKDERHEGRQGLDGSQRQCSTSKTRANCGSQAPRGCAVDALQLGGGPPPQVPAAAGGQPQGESTSAALVPAAVMKTPAGMAPEAGMPASDAEMSAAGLHKEAAEALAGSEVERKVQLSCGEHTDYGLLTIVNQDDGVTALQVRNAAGRWVDAHPVAGAFVCNIGDMMKVWTNGLYMPTVHRVINGHPTKSRVSIPFFYEPAFETVVAPLPELVRRQQSGPAQGGRHDTVAGQLDGSQRPAGDSPGGVAQGSGVPTAKFSAVRYGTHLEGKVLNNFETQ